MLALVYLGTFALYALTCAPALGWLDTSELIAAGASLGVPHSPGHPLAVMLARAMTLVPVGDLAFRVNLASALAMAGSVTVVAVTLRRLTQVLAADRPRASRQLLTACAATAMAVSACLWLQAVRAEVYALELLFITLAFDAAVAFALSGAASALVRLGLCAGLALTTHYVIALTVLLPALAVLACKPALWRARPRATGSAGLVTIVGLSSWAYLPVRAARDPIVDWGDPDRLSRLWWTVSGRAFTGSVTAQHTSSLGVDLAQCLAAVLGSQPLLSILAAVGIYLSIRLRRARGITLMATGTLVACVLARAVLGFDPETPDHVGYLAPAVVALATLAVIGVASLAGVMSRESWSRASAITATALAAVTALVGAARWPAMDHSRAHAADELARVTVDVAPPRAIVLTSYFQTAFRMMALEAAEGARPDLDIVDRSFLSYPGQAEVDRHRHPRLAAAIAAGLGPGHPLPRPQLDALAARYAILVEPHVNLTGADHAILGLAGAFARYGGREDDSGVARFEHELAAIEARAPAPERFWIRMHRLWNAYLEIDHECHRGDRARAQRALDAGLALAPRDTLLQSIAATCHLHTEATPHL